MLEARETQRPKEGGLGWELWTPGKGTRVCQARGLGLKGRTHADTCNNAGLTFLGQGQRKQRARA